MTETALAMTQWAQVNNVSDWSEVPSSPAPFYIISAESPGYDVRSEVHSPRTAPTIVFLSEV
jgi:hypothetical protein